MFPTSSPIACSAREGDVESGLLCGSPLANSACASTPRTVLLDGVACTAVASASPPIEVPRNVYTRSHSTMGQSSPKRGFIENLKHSIDSLHTHHHQPHPVHLQKRTRQRSINIPTSPDFELMTDLGCPPPLHDPPPEVYGYPPAAAPPISAHSSNLARSAPDSGFFTTFRSRSKSDASAAFMTPRRQSGVLVFFQQSSSKSSNDDSSIMSPSAAVMSPSARDAAGALLQTTPVRAPRLGSRGGESKSFEGHLPGVNSLFSSSSSNSSSNSSNEGHHLHGGGGAHAKSSPRRPLYVDTQLANEVVVGSSDKTRASPIAQMVDAVGRRMRTSSLTSPTVQPIGARASFSTENAFSPKSPGVRGGPPSGRPPLYRYSRMGQQHSLDSGLDLSSPIAGHALLIREVPIIDLLIDID